MKPKKNNVLELSISKWVVLVRSKRSNWKKSAIPKQPSDKSKLIDLKLHVTFPPCAFDNKHLTV